MLCLLRLDCKSNVRLKSLYNIGFRLYQLNFIFSSIMHTPGSAAAERPPEETEEQRLLESQLYTARNATENTEVLAPGISDGRSGQNGSSGDSGCANLWRAPAGELACRRVRMLAAIPQHDAHARCSLPLLAAAAFWNSGVAVALGSCVCFATAGALVKSPPIQVGGSRGVSWPLWACVHPDSCLLGLRSPQTDSHPCTAPPHTKQAVHEACQVWRLRRPAPPCRRRHTTPAWLQGHIPVFEIVVVRALVSTIVTSLSCRAGGVPVFGRTAPQALLIARGVIGGTAMTVRQGQLPGMPPTAVGKPLLVFLQAL